MAENLLDPITLFFLLGILAGVLKSDLRLPDAIYDLLSIYLLLAIGLKGGVQLASTNAATRVFPPVLGTLLLGIIIPVVAFAILRFVGKFARADAAAVAAHYGSVSAVTFAVVLAYLDQLAVPYEGIMALLLVVLEIPAIIVGILLARLGRAQGRVPYGPLAHEVLMNKSVYLLLGGLAIGWIAGPEGVAPLKFAFVDGFKGALAFFLLEMGIVAAQRLVDLRSAGFFLLIFGITMPLISGALGAVAGRLTGLSHGGTAVLATMAASSSYIAAPAAMRIAVPEANPTLYLTASLGITFPFNLTLGIPIYYAMARLVHSL